MTGHSNHSPQSSIERMQLQTVGSNGGDILGSCAGMTSEASLAQMRHQVTCQCGGAGEGGGIGGDGEEDGDV